VFSHPGDFSVFDVVERGDNLQKAFIHCVLGHDAVAKEIFDSAPGVCVSRFFDQCFSR